MATFAYTLLQPFYSRLLQALFCARGLRRAVVPAGRKVRGWWAIGDGDGDDALDKGVSRPKPLSGAPALASLGIPRGLTLVNRTVLRKCMSAWQARQQNYYLFEFLVYPFREQKTVMSGVGVGLSFRGTVWLLHLSEEAGWAVK